MHFSSGQYAIFLVAVFFVFWALARLHFIRTLFLLAASYYFYANWDPTYLLLIFLSSNVDYRVGRALGAAREQRRRKALLAVSVFVNLGVVCTFKYFNFLSDSFAWTAGLVGMEMTATHLDVLLPVGVSFYTFQSMSYTIDVYRNQLAPEKSYFRYLLFVALFPQLVAGPIVRAAHLLPQLARKPVLAPQYGSRGLFLILLGLVKKVAIADYLAVNLVDRVFDFPERFSSVEVLAAVYGYAFQIYCDFSGYSDIAIGSALLLGLTIPKNFDSPYRSRSLQEFWRRWHISLSTWLRDYLYIPLGGSKKGPNATYVNLMITMVLGGLWHGAAWTFVAWGALHGWALAVTRLYQRARAGKRAGPVGQAMGVVVTFHFVCLCWILFRSQSVDQAVSIVTQIATGGLWVENLHTPILAVLGLALATHWLPADLLRRVYRTWASLPATAQAATATIVASILYHVASTDVVPFIYFQF